MPPASDTAAAPTPAPSARLTFDQSFAVARGRPGGIGLVPFVPAGYPSLDATVDLLPALEACGATVIEVGFPFSDPVADGPIIQEAFTHALAKGAKVADVFAAVRAARPRVSVPIVGMLSYSIVFRYGLPRFIADAKAAGLDGLIIPDLPPPEAQRVTGTIHAGGLATSLLVAPTTAPDRRAEIAKLSTGFVYYLSVSGITGERDQLPPDLADSVRAVKALTDRPVCVGFGISKPHHMAMLRGVADGAIVGSAIVRRMKEHESAVPAAVTAAVRDYLTELTQV
ncbi:MAG: trpA [Phycisphaerales bacterium]|nr:trpA [Phycisphaerales bacterium]